MKRKLIIYLTNQLTIYVIFIAIMPVTIFVNLFSLYICVILLNIDS